MSRRHPKRRTSTGRVAVIPLAVLEHPSVTTLKHAPFRVLIFLAAAFNGHNNGALGITATQAAERGIGSKNTLYESLRELVVRGLIQETYPASRVPPRPTMYALTWRPLDDTDYSTSRTTPSHAYREWRRAT